MPILSPCSYWVGCRALLLVTLFCSACGLPGSASADVSFTFTAVGDFGSNDHTTATLDRIAGENPDFHLALGDFDYQGLGEPAWCNYVRSHLGANVPVELIAGNHEDDERENGYIDNFTRCLPDGLDTTGNYGKEYFFDYRGLARFIMISPSLTIGDDYYYYAEGSSHEHWLEQTINDARAAGIPWVIVGMHEPCLSVGDYYCPIFEGLMNLLIDKKVDLVLQGHDHTYQRTRQLALGPSCPQVTGDQFNPQCITYDGKNGLYIKGNGPVFVVAGMAGGELYDVHPDMPQAGYFAQCKGKNSDPTWGFMQYTVSRDKIAAAFIGSSPASGYTDTFTIAAVTPVPGLLPAAAAALAGFDDVIYPPRSRNRSECVLP